MHYPKEKKEKTASVLLEVGSLMMSSGANTERIRVTMQRIASTWGYHLELMITHRALIMTLSDEEGEFSFSKIRRISTHTVNFSVVTGISHMSWNVAKGGWSVDDVINEVERLKQTPHFNRWLTLTLVGVADAAFCYLFGGGWVAMFVAFVATFCGLWVRQETTKRQMNPYVIIFLAALTASLISQLAYYIPICITPDKAFATSVLFLIPGVHLVNSITDLIDGNFQNGVARGVNTLIISFAIAFGMMVAKLIYSLFI